MSFFPVSRLFWIIVLYTRCEFYIIAADEGRRATHSANLFLTTNAEFSGWPSNVFSGPGQPALQPPPRFDPGPWAGQVNFALYRDQQHLGVCAVPSIRLCLLTSF